MICPCKSPHWAVNYRVSALSIPIWENDTISLLSLTLTTITSMQVQTSKHQDHLMSIPPSNPPKQNYCMYHVLVSIPICEIKNQKEWHWPPNIITYLYNVTLVSCLREFILLAVCVQPLLYNHLFYGCMVYHLLLLQLQKILFCCCVMCIISCC